MEQIYHALRVLNQYDVHIAYNLLMFEPDTILYDILINLRFMEKHIENPFNFCRAEAYAGTGLEAKLRAEGRLLGDMFGFDYRLKDPRSEAFHQIANYAFFDRNFSDYGLHYFNMEVDFYFQLLRRFNPDLLSQTLRASVRNFIKRTNLDTYECLCQIYDFVATEDNLDYPEVRAFSLEMRRQVDERGRSLHREGEAILNRLTSTFANQEKTTPLHRKSLLANGLSFLATRPLPYNGVDQLGQLEFISEGSEESAEPLEFFGTASGPVPYSEFKKRLSSQNE